MFLLKMGFHINARVKQVWVCHNLMQRNGGHIVIRPLCGEMMQNISHDAKHPDTCNMASTGHAVWHPVCSPASIKAYTLGPLHGGKCAYRFVTASALCS